MDVPVLGEEYYFFDDGKTSPSRCYKAKVVGVYPYDSELIVDVFDYSLDKIVQKPIQEIHRDEINEHRQGINFKVLNGNTTIGEPWLYAEETDYFIKCEIEGYDENPIWFVRTINDEWFSMNVTNSWQSGILDVDWSIYKDAKHSYDMYSYEGSYDIELISKGEYIDIYV